MSLLCAWNIVLLFLGSVLALCLVSGLQVFSVALWSGFSFLWAGLCFSSGSGWGRSMPRGLGFLVLTSGPPPIAAVDGGGGGSWPCVACAVLCCN